MRLEYLRRYFEDRAYLDRQIAFYKKKRLISFSEAGPDTLGHMQKAKHNLQFLEVIKEDFNDWALVVCYYSSYHAALSLLLTKNLHTKSHDATLCLLIKHFYKKGLSKEDIELLTLFDADDLLFYADSKIRRIEASYSTKIMFDLAEVEIFKKKTVSFVNKVRTMIEHHNSEATKKYL
jgi:uncharacterized protein (UPF0332 family)